MRGQEQRLLDAIRRGSAPHGILLTGPEGCDMAGIARRAAALYCLGEAAVDALANCPDYQELGGGGSIGVDEIRGMQSALSARPFGQGRAVLLIEAHRMTEAAQNALLKTLEEPPHDTMLFLAGEEAGLLPTIRSRCGVIRLGAVQEDTLAEMLRKRGAGLEEACRAARLSGGAPLLADRMISPEYGRFFAEAAQLFLRTQQSTLPPYAELAALLNMQPLGESATRSKTEERRESGRHCLLIWQHIAREQLHLLLGLEEPCRVLGPQQRHALHGRFTIGRIQSIIELILSAERRIGAANPQLTMDALLTALCMPADERKEQLPI